MKSETMQANKDESVEIKKSDRFCYHVRLEKRSVRPGNEQYPEVGHQIKCFPQKTFEKMEALRNGPHKIIWYKAGGYVSATVVHDPTLEPDEEGTIIEPVKSTVKSSYTKEQRKTMIKVNKIMNAAKESAASDK